MTREEQIEITSLSYSCVGSAIDFEAGAKWADDNPKEGLIDLSQAWHDASEIPRDDSLIIVQSIYGDILLQRFANRKSGMASIHRWAYINDLLPKNVSDETIQID